MFKHTDLVPFVNEVRNNVIGYDKLWDSITSPSFYTYTTESFPKDNVFHVGDNEIVIELALAGYRKEDVTISREENYVVITGSREEEFANEDNVKTIRKGIAARSFTKRYTVASEYKDINASLEDGILTISLVRKPEKEKKQIIEIK